MSVYPQRSWAIILQQAWSMYLTDQHGNDSKNFGGPPGSGNKRKKKACKRFNRGKCHDGPNCKYDHRCTIPECGKFGHGAHICCKRQNNTAQVTQTGTSASATTSK